MLTTISESNCTKAKSRDFYQLLIDKTHTEGHTKVWLNCHLRANQDLPEV